MHSSEYSGSCSEKRIKRANGICVRPDANILHAQGVDELNMRMGHAQQVQGFVHNMQHAQGVQELNMNIPHAMVGCERERGREGERGERGRESVNVAFLPIQNAAKTAWTNDELTAKP
jgi:hypothetical protein